MKKKLLVVLLVVLVLSLSIFLVACDEEESKSAQVVITFDSAGGSVVPAMLINKDTTIEAAPTAPTRAGYTFKGWYLDDAEFKFGETIITGNVILTAKWEKNASSGEEDIEGPITYKVRFYDGNNQLMKSEMVEIGESATAPTDIPTKRTDSEFIYVFKGWDKDFTNVTKDLTINAEFNTINRIVSEGDFTYILAEDQSSYAIGAKSGMTLPSEIEIPSTFNDKPVNKIGDYAFVKHDELISVVIPESITSIGVSAFNGCKLLENVNIPSGVTTIGEEAFRDCYVLESLVIPESVTSIGDYLFRGCYMLNNINLPTGITNIPTGMFQDCKSLTGLEIPKNITSIGEGAFSRCIGLTSITIPNSVERIGESAFSMEEGIDEVSNSLTSVIFEKGSKITRIERYTFVGCAIESIEIPASVQVITWYSFKSCESLKEVTFEEGSKLQTIEENSFWFSYSLTTIVFPTGLKKIGGDAFYDCSSLKKVYIPKTVIEVGDGAFAFCSQATFYLEVESIPLSWNTKWNNYGSSNILYNQTGLPE